MGETCGYATQTQTAIAQGRFIGVAVVGRGRVVSAVPNAERADRLARVRVFFLGEAVQINAGRLLAEALLIVALTAIALVYVWSEDA